MRYDWRRAEFPQFELSNKPQVGFLAQEVEKLLPEAVTKDDQGYYAVNYSAVVPVLVEALKEQQQQIEKQQQQIARLEAEAATATGRAATAEAGLASFEQRLRALEGGGAQARR